MSLRESTLVKLRLAELINTFRLTIDHAESMFNNPKFAAYCRRYGFVNEAHEHQKPGDSGVWFWCPDVSTLVTNKIGMFNSQYWRSKLKRYWLAYTKNLPPMHPKMNELLGESND